MLTFDQIKELIDLISERQLQGLEIERAGFRLKIDGEQALQASSPVLQAPVLQPVAPAPAAAPATTPSAAPQAAPLTGGAEAEAADAHANDFILKSPIVGTFYEAPSPDSPPFAKVGDRVSKGQVLCIVEAMKLMNEIESTVNGTVTKVFTKNAQAVEYDEPLFAIEEA